MTVAQLLYGPFRGPREFNRVADAAEGLEKDAGARRVGDYGDWFLGGEG